MSKTYYYLIHIQYLGFRFSGWAKQPKVKTIHQMIDKTMCFMFGENRTKTLGCSRTDAKVSANHFVFELFIDEEVLDFNEFINGFNSNSPADLKALRIEKTTANFNIINHSKIKEYVYLFAYGQKAHPFSAPLVTTVNEKLDIELMKKGAKCFEGTHNFVRYGTKLSNKTNTIRTINLCEIIENNLYKANFFPEQTFLMRIQSKGFMRNQVRLIMGQLFELGKGYISIVDIKNSLTGENTNYFNTIAPQSGLILQNVSFDK
ncbi:MAG TPA: tRNA pseudouridine(38-40) synthase TruA [Crocinitomix sp.]|nr:tRNA pseudouridine(38-40) synthase TruA [Crocinitomix sp.]